MPVEADDFNGRVVLWREAATQRDSDEPDNQAGANDHVQGVQAGHGEIKREIELRVRVGVGIVRGNCGFFQFLPLESKCLRIIRWHLLSSGRNWKKPQFPRTIPTPTLTRSSISRFISP